MTLSDEVAAEVQRLRREKGMGPSEAINSLARLGMTHQESRKQVYEHHTAKLGLKVDVHDVASVLELLESEDGA